MILSDVLTCTVPPLRVESSLLKNPIPPKYYLISTPHGEALIGSGRRATQRLTMNIPVGVLVYYHRTPGCCFRSRTCSQDILGCAADTLMLCRSDYFLSPDTAEGEARLRRLDASRLWAPSTPKGKFLCGPRRRQAKLGPAALRALCAALRLARRLGLLLRCRLGGGGGRRLLAAGGRDAAQLLPRHVGGAVRLDALGALYVVSRAAGSTVM